MSTIADKFIKDQLQKQFYAQAAQKLGIQDEQSKALAQKAMPLLVKGLAENVQTKSGAQNLWNALKQKKHDGKILDSNEDFFEEAKLEDGSKILKHILGDTRNDIAAALAEETKTDVSAAKKTLAALSPIVMGTLGKAVPRGMLLSEQVLS
jgi:hypothetical protein